MITPDMADFLSAQRLGYVATVSPDGSPNVSPKGSIFAWDDSHLVFAHIRSPDTVRNIAHNPMLEISCVDPVLRRGYLFRGTGEVLPRGRLYSEVLSFFRKRGIGSRISGIVLVTVDSVSEVLSPIYDARD